MLRVGEFAPPFQLQPVFGLPVDSSALPGALVICLLGGLSYRVDVIERDGRSLWRLQAGPLGESRARDVCAALKSRGEACLLVRG